MRKKTARKKKKLHQKIHHHIINNPLLSISLLILLILGGVVTTQIFAAKPVPPTGQFELIDVNNSGVKADQPAEIVDMTKNGQYILFKSKATNLGVTIDKEQLFVRDRNTNTTEMVSIMPDGNQFTDPTNSLGGFLSGDGRYVSFFDSSAIYLRDRQTQTTNMVATLGNRGILDMTSDTRYYVFRNSFPGRQNPFTIYLYDSQTGTTEALAVNSNGEHADHTGGDTAGGMLSDDGRYVVFTSRASNLVPNDTNNIRDIFIRDRQTGITSFLYGNETPGGEPYISTDGSFVLFGTDRALVPQDQNGIGDYYLLNRQTETVDLVTVTDNGKQTTDLTSFGKISDDGRYIIFATQSTNFNRYDSTWLVAYLRDRATGTTELIGQNPFCKSALFTVDLFVSNDGQFVAFNTPDRASEIDTDDNSNDVYLRDRSIPFGRLPKHCR